jgi:hypothetical protein
MVIFLFGLQNRRQQAGTFKFFGNLAYLKGFPLIFFKNDKK